MSRAEVLAAAEDFLKPGDEVALTPRVEPLRCFSLAQALTDPTLLEPPAPVVAPFLYAGRVTLLSGREKSGKTTLLAGAAAALTRGGSFLGDALRPARVLWLSLDESLADTVRRFHLLGADPDRLILCTDIPSAASLKPVLEEGGFALVCIDTLNELLSGKSLNRSEEVLPTLRPLVTVIRESGAAGCIVSHAGKASGGYLGSVTIGGLVDAPLTLKRVATGEPISLDPGAEVDEDDTTDDGRRVLVGLTRWGGKLRVRLAFDGTRYVLGDAPLPLTVRILRELAAGEAGSAALTGVLRVRKDRVLEALRELETRGAVKRVRGGSVITDVGRDMLRPAVPGVSETPLERPPREPLAGTAEKEAEPLGNGGGTGAEPLGNRNGNQRFQDTHTRHVNPGTATRMVRRDGLEIRQALRPTAHGDRWLDESQGPAA